MSFTVRSRPITTLASEHPANHCTGGQRGHVRPVKSFMGPYQTDSGEWDGGTLVFYGLLGIVFFHLKAIKGLPSMESLTAWGRDMVHLGSGWRRRLNPFSATPCSSHTSCFHLTTYISHGAQRPQYSLDHRFSV